MANPRLGLGNISLTPLAVFEVKTGQIARPLLTQQNSGQSKKKIPSLLIRGAGKKAEGGEGVV